MYEKKLRRLLQSVGCDEQANGEEENAVLYSDSEDEKEGENKFCYFFTWLVMQQRGLLFCDLQSLKEIRTKQLNTLNSHSKT